MHSYISYTSIGEVAIYAMLYMYNVTYLGLMWTIYITILVVMYIIYVGYIGYNIYHY